eukprot:1655276-Prymnesium_polylepis.1
MTVQLLLHFSKVGESVNKAKGEASALVLACKGSHLSTGTALLAAGADPRIVDPVSKQTPLEIANKNADEDLAGTIGAALDKLPSMSRTRLSAGRPSSKYPIVE